VAIALVFVWLGLVLGISFIEAPLKFRAPGVTREVGLGIGRLVFRAFNVAELLLALLGAQTVMLHAFMDRRAARNVAGETLPPSKHHHVYIALELTKVILLIVTGTMLLREITG